MLRQLEKAIYLQGEYHLHLCSRSQILLINGAQACNVYFVAGTSITIGAAAKLVGNYLAHVAITVANAASNQGTLCALTAAVTLINDASSLKLVLAPLSCYDFQGFSFFLARFDCVSWQFYFFISVAY